MRLRRAQSDDRAALDRLTLAGIRHWGHHESHPAVYAALVEELEGYADPTERTVVVWEDDQGVAGFVDLEDRGDEVELLRMFLRTELIGRGHGRALWDVAVATATAIADELVIVADPRARGFYEAMGAVAEREVVVEEGFVLTVLRVDLIS